MLRLNIDGEWEPEDFIEVLGAIEALYCIAELPRHRWFEFDPWVPRRYGASSFAEHMQRANDWVLAESRMQMPGHRRIVVRAINYASPGKIDFAGLGQAMEAIDRMIGRLIAVVTERRKRREQDEQAAVDTEIKRESLR